ncbi:serine hydrolase domain-containing protein [Pleionea mediterranea]|uniref:CubicO group peptidase (Beta-lactamase class C family) n=1 Tax=Pleionea mediterranea TaxID=523701 RepID=A0A316F8Q0_9GAMM|nr:serine hydrolase domain-containing protein [Pleionea mediterranea]PWK43593.1 CubicO group peptidase (beta-lactamase class C family) [Pleionea mediterranea]
MKILIFICTSVLLIGCRNIKTEQLTTIPENVKSSIQKAVNSGHRPGVVIGLTNPNGSYFYSYGTAEAGKEKAINKNTQFAIGSLTKLFTSELLHLQVRDKVVTYQTQLKTIWPQVNDGANTELWQLADHKAALPRKISSNALANNDASELLALLKREVTLPSNTQYSNAGFAILGLALMETTEADLSSLLEKKVLKPMGLKDTGYQASFEHLASPHHVMMSIKSFRSEVPSIAHGAGGLYSTANDLITFLNVKMEPASKNLSSTKSVEDFSFEKLGWKKHQDDSFISYYHGGDGNGYQAFIGYRPDNRAGVVLLSNSSADDDLQQIALHLINPGIDLPDFETPPARMLSHESLAPLVGEYFLKSDPEGNSFNFISDEGQMIYLEKTPNNKVVRRTRLFGVTDKKFEMAEMPLTIDFSMSKSDSFDAIMRYQNKVFYLVKKQ